MEIKRGSMFDYDLENTPLQIKTNSTVGSNDLVRVWFYHAEGEPAGRVDLYFRSPPRYWLEYCSSGELGFLSASLPSETDKILTLVLDRTSDARLLIFCNDVEVLNVVLSDTTCGRNDWREYWYREAKKIIFAPLDTGSDKYRPGEWVMHLKILPSVKCGEILYNAGLINLLYEFQLVK